jgi:hypothetical protein
MGPPELARSDSGPVAALLNRRVRPRTHGGVGGREGRPSLPPDHFGTSRCQWWEPSTASEADSGESSRSAKS